MSEIQTTSDGFPKPRQNPGGEPCGECHLKPGETCDICGAVSKTTRPRFDWLGDFVVPIVLPFAMTGAVLLAFSHSKPPVAPAAAVPHASVELCRAYHEWVETQPAFRALHTECGETTKRGPLDHVEYLGDGNAVFRFTCGAELLVPVDDVEAELKLVRAEHVDNDGWQMAVTRA